MAFPDSDLDIIIRAYLGANPNDDPDDWPSPTDLSDRLMRRPIQITRGRRPGQKTAAAGSCVFWLENTDGALTPLLPTSIYYPDWDLGCPMTVSVDNVGTNPPYRRFGGFIADITAVMIPGVGGENISAVKVTLSGVIRRITQGSVAKSAPYRYLLTLDGESTEPVAAWALEDGPLVSGAAPLYGTKELAPWVGTHPSGAVVSYPQWGTGDLGPWLPSVVSRTTAAGFSILAATVKMSSFSTTWTVDLMWASGTDAGDSGADAAAATVDINPSYLPKGAIGWPQLAFWPDIQQITVAMNGEPEVATDTPELFDGLGHHVRWTATQSGGNVAWTVSIDGTQAQSSTTSGAMTLTAVKSIGLLANSVGGAVAQGYVAVYTTPPTLADASAAYLGYPGEQAHERFERICDEEGIPYFGTGTDSVTMGPQPYADVMAILRECETVDHGLLIEHEFFGLDYRTSRQRENLTPSMTVDLSTYKTTSGTQADVLTPVRNDARVRNEWTVTRTNGASATVKDETHQARFGRYNDSATINVETDDMVQDQAGWLVSEGTFNRLRYGDVPVDLGANE